MREFLMFVFTAVGTSAVAITALGVLTRSLMKHWLDKDIARFQQRLSDNSQHEIATFKQRLQDDSLREVERYKAELDLARVKLEISYGGIFEKQANAILEIDEAIRLLQDAADIYNSDSDEIENRKALTGAYIQAWKKLDSLRLYLPKDIDREAFELISLAHVTPRKVASLEKRFHKGLSGLSGEAYDRLDRDLTAASEKLFNDIPQLRENLRKQFRALLGIETHNKN